MLPNSKEAGRKKYLRTLSKAAERVQLRRVSPERKARHHEREVDRMFAFLTGRGLAKVVGAEA